MLDLKARAGYSFGRVLPYAVVGWSRTDWTNGTFAPVKMDGFAYGIRADYQVTNQVLVGLEYLHRDLSADNFVEVPTDQVESTFSTIAFRLAYRF